MIYICIALLVYALFFFKNEYATANSYTNLKDKYQLKNKQISYLAILILIVFASARATTVGYDTPNYNLNFLEIAKNNKISDGHNFEPLFQIINWLAAVLFGKSGFSFVLFICELIILACVVYSGKRLTTNLTLAVYFFVTIDVYLRGFGQLRQSVAIALLMCATSSLLNKDFCRYFAFVILAFMFHKTSIVFAPIGFCCLLKTDKSRLIFYIATALCAAVFCVFETQIISIVCNILHLDYYDRYIVTDLWTQELSTIGHIEMVIIIAIFFAFYLFKLLCNKKAIALPKSYNLLLDIYFFSCIFYIISGVCQSPAIYGRLVYLFFWPIIFLAPQIISVIKNRRIKTLLYICELILALGYLIATTFVIDAYGIMPYVLA